MYEIEPDHCDCSCHYDGMTVHLVPCCEKCPFCGVLLTYGMGPHMERCVRRTTEEPDAKSIEQA